MWRIWSLAEKETQTLELAKICDKYNLEKIHCLLSTWSGLYRHWEGAHSRCLSSTWNDTPGASQSVIPVGGQNQTHCFNCKRDLCLRKQTRRARDLFRNYSQVISVQGVLYMAISATPQHPVPLVRWHQRVLGKHITNATQHHRHPWPDLAWFI